ncbi:hypothetical protein LTR84_011510 [Exophiala bonariae]|uniref:Xylanolytic transcriptional activator regulatory domain-containing protein n=1 Tax=Exophiala bonariae TaxID=1690606 RepID=A0AAV9NG65_9EURO|nr:hypothetical protein LTR84_011510 [Exophiala bonariae]
MRHPVSDPAADLVDENNLPREESGAHPDARYITSSAAFGLGGNTDQPEVYTSMAGGYDDQDFGFDWGLASEDIFTLLRSDHETLNLALPISTYAQAIPEGQTCLSTGSIDESMPTSSVDVSRDAIHALSQVIKELPGKLVAELENTDVASSFFDECMEFFFTIFLPTFPIIHRPTFHARDCGSPLLLNMLALGSSFIDSSEAGARSDSSQIDLGTLQGESLWSLAHAVVATSWPTLMSHRGPHDNCDGVQLVQTAALGQLYAIMSGTYTLRMTSQVFHGLGFYWSRECGMFASSIARRTTVPSISAPETEKAEAWRTWAVSEAQLRALLTHYILDGLIAQFSGNPTCVRHGANALPMPVSVEAFDAATPNDWIQEMGKGDHFDMTFRDFIYALFQPSEACLSKQIPELAMRVVLESLQSMVSEEADAGGRTIGTPSRREICNAMLRLYRSQITTSPNTAELLLRWHCIFISMTVSIRTLCDLICDACQVSEKIFRQRSTQARQHYHDIKSWTATCDARRALLHAFAIRDLIQKLPVGRSHVIHLPYAIFMAAAIQAAFMVENFQVIAVPAIIDWDIVWQDGNATSVGASPVNDISSLETQQFLQNTFAPVNTRNLSRKMSLELHNLRMQLTGISSHWGLSHLFGKVLDQWRQKLRP